MEVTYEITVDDYRDCNRIACLHTTPRRRRNYWCTTVASPLLGCILLLLAVYLIIFLDATFNSQIVVLIFAIFLLWMPLSYRQSVKRLYSQHKFDVPLRLVLNDRGISIRRQDNAAESTLVWSILDGYAEADRHYVLFPSLASFIPVPKRALNADQQVEFMQFLSAHATRK